MVTVIVTIATEEGLTLEALQDSSHSTQGKLYFLEAPGDPSWLVGQKAVGRGRSDHLKGPHMTCYLCSKVNDNQEQFNLGEEMRSRGDLCHCAVTMTTMWYLRSELGACCRNLGAGCRRGDLEWWGCKRVGRNCRGGWLLGLSSAAVT